MKLGLSTFVFVLTLGMVFGAVQYGVTVPEVEVHLDRPDGSFYSFGSYFEVNVKLDSPAYIKVYALNLEGKYEKLFPQGYTMGKFYPGSYSLGKFTTHIYGLVYIQVVAIPDMKSLDEYKGSKEIEMFKIPRLKFPRGSDVTYMFYGKKERFGVLEVKGPEGNYVTLDEKLEFRVPKKLFVPLGKHSLKYEYNGKNYETSFFVNEGARITLNIPAFAVIPIAEKYSVNLSSFPDEALVFVDGSYVGRTPINLRLEKGYHVIRLEKDGYETYEKLLYLNEDTSMVVNLKRGKSKVHFSSVPSGALVFINGENFGRTPLEIELEYGEYQITYIKEGYFTVVYDVYVNRPEEYFERTMVPIGE